MINLHAMLPNFWPLCPECGAGAIENDEWCCVECGCAVILPDGLAGGAILNAIKHVTAQYRAVVEAARMHANWHNCIGPDDEDGMPELLEALAKLDGGGK
jgi:transcription initiation factor TFIIIB Brf1 subunit/transcription initiation factor TFIIB